MARKRPLTPRRPVEVAPALPDELPEKLKRCFVEDWITPDDWTEASEEAALNVGTPRTVAEVLTVRANRRFVEARREWARERGLDWRKLSGGSIPRWRARPEEVASRG